MEKQYKVTSERIKMDGLKFGDKVKIIIVKTEQQWARLQNKKRWKHIQEHITVMEEVLMTQEERAYNYASTQKPTKLQVGEIAKHYNNGYNQAMQDFLEKAEKILTERMYFSYDEAKELVEDFVVQFKNYMQNESEK